MADISGIVTVGGATPTDYVYVDAYDLTEPHYAIQEAGIIDWEEDATASQVDGSYTITGLVAGHDYMLIAGNAVDTARPVWINAATNWMDSHAVTAPAAGVNFACPAYAGGSMISGVSLNCPPGTSFVFGYIIDPDVGITVGVIYGPANGAYAGLWQNLYAFEDYRIFCVAVDDGWNALATLWYDGHQPNEGYFADTVLGNATGVNLDFANAKRTLHRLFIPAGTGPRFSKPSPSKRHLLKK